MSVYCVFLTPSGSMEAALLSIRMFVNLNS
jgi:hypothetical protein